MRTPLGRAVVIATLTDRHGGLQKQFKAILEDEEQAHQPRKNKARIAG